MISVEKGSCCGYRREVAAVANVFENLHSNFGECSYVGSL